MWKCQKLSKCVKKVYIIFCGKVEKMLKPLLFDFLYNYMYSLFIDI